jgi:hypothetical protein
MLRYYLHINPSTLTDEQWAKEIALLEYVRTLENFSTCPECK